MDFQDKTALITGGSSGIGLATARLLAARGMHVWLLARDENRLADALAQVEAACATRSQRCGVVSADVSDRSQVAEALTRVTASVGLPDLVINSAGIVWPGYVQELPAEAFEQQIAVNYLGTVYMTQAVLPGMIARGNGHIVNVASAAGFIGMIGYAAYAPSKFAVRGFSDVLRGELKPYGIRLSIVYPPDTETPQLVYDKQMRPAEIDRIVGSVSKAMSADAVARAIVAGIARGRYVILPGIETAFFYRLIQLLGDLQYPIMDWLIARARQKGIR